MYFRHDRIRNHQLDLVKDTYNAIENGKILLAQAPTGIGKSDAVLGAALTYAVKNDLAVFFLTPKISQHKIAVEVVKGIAKKYETKICGVDMLGRRYSCIEQSLKDLDHEGFYQACQRKRRDETCSFYGNARGYSKIQEVKAENKFRKFLDNYEGIKNHEQVIEYGETEMLCPYEYMLKLAQNSRVIIADYFHVMVPGIRELFLRKINKKLDRSIIIVDEAHNLAKRIRDQLSSTANSFLLKRAEKELKLLGADNIRIERAFAKWSNGILKEKREKLVSKAEFGSFFDEFKMQPNDLADYIESAGVEIIEKTNKKSACLRIAKFIKNWQLDEPSSIRVLRERGGYFSLSKKFLDPSQATQMLNEAHSAILMSGTFLPLEMHRDILGLNNDKVIMKNYLSPFEKKNKLNIIYDGVTTQYAKRTIENYKKMSEKIDKIIAASPPGVAIFFPSYSVMKTVTLLMKNENLIIQKESSTPKEIGEMLRDFSNYRGVLCAVQGGSLSEGVDYANNDIKTVIVLGIALEEPDLETQARIDFYDEKFGKGWEYGYTYPAVTKAIQAAGRAIRKETDRAAIVYMDERFKWKNYNQILGDNGTFIVTYQPEKYVEEFWREK